MLSLAVHKTTVCVQIEIVHEPIVGLSVANVAVFPLVFEVLLPDAPDVVEIVNRWAFTETRSFARGCHDSTELFIFITRVDEV